MFATLTKVGSAIAALAAIASLTPTMLSQAQLSGQIRIDGASAGYPITEAIAIDFMALSPDVDITSEVSGTGGGFRKFCAGETDITQILHLAGKPLNTALH